MLVSMVVYMPMMLLLKQKAYMIYILKKRLIFDRDIWLTIWSKWIHNSEKWDQAKCDGWESLMYFVW
jgi:hypothetical protein